MLKLDDDFLNLIACMGFALTVANYKENLEQSNADDVIQELNEKGKIALNELEGEIKKQNEMLRQILKGVQK